MERLKTSGQIARELRMPFPRVIYVLATHHIEPVAKIGPIRLFGPEAIDKIRAARRQIEKRRRRVAG